MISFIRIALCFFCCTSAASVAARRLNQNIIPPASRSKSQSPYTPQFQHPGGVQQEKQFVSEPLSWRYPDPPKEEAPRFPPHFELKVPKPVESVSALCGENAIRVEVKKDLLGIGKPVRTEEVTLGGCAAVGEDSEAKIIIFESELHDCGSQLLMTEDFLIYVFTLLYTPTPMGNGFIVRGRDVSVSIECQYLRKHDVSSGQLKPTWLPFTDRKESEENLAFSLTLMTDDWQHPRPSSQFLLGDMIKFEASLKQFHHAPLRVDVDSCVATAVPNIDTVPRYTFLGDKGCLFDSQLTGSTSKFLPRTRDDKLYFEVEAFRFEQDHNGVLYITCSLKATPAVVPVSTTSKACSFSNGWREASGIHHSCSCCDDDCDGEDRSDLSRRGPVLEQESVVGPIVVKERPLQGRK